jgi:oxygen-dependent protoporphyrinogen oxidase
MEELPRLLAGRLPAGAVRFGERATDVTRDGGGWRVVADGGAAWSADTLILAPEAHQAARLVRYLDPALSHLLAGVPYASSATVTLGYRREQIAHPLDGFGFVVPQVERRPVIACTFSSVKYPGRAPDGHALLRVFVGGALNESALDASDESLIVTARGELGALLGVTGEPMLARVARHPKAMPQYEVGHLARVEAIEQCLARQPGLGLAGAGYRGVGIADCVRSGEAAAERALA